MKQTRKIKKTYRSISGKVAYKDTSLDYESSLERDFLYYHTFRDEVIDIIPQPIQILFKKNGRTYEYTPDYFVQIKDGYGKSLLVEVKPESEWRANWRDWSEKWKAAIVYCKERGFRFAIYDEIRIHHYALDNINFLMRYKNLAVSTEQVKALLEAIELRGTTTVGFLLEHYFKGKALCPVGQQILWHLMANKLIEFDIWTDVKNPNMEVWHVR